jgi:TM2 domain-containing membrane protein YozV
MLTQWQNGAMKPTAPNSVQTGADTAAAFPSPPAKTVAPIDGGFKNKTLATLFASLGGSIGLHRFYLHGPGKVLPWLYAVFSFTLIPTFAGFIEALVFGLTPDDKWDEQWNAASGRKNHSSWPVVITVALTLLIGAGLMVTLLAVGLGAYWGAGETG